MIINRFSALLGDKISRERRNISLREVAQETGVAKRSLLMWKKNAVARFDAPTIEALCLYFHCQPGDLLILEKDPEPEPEKELQA